ncbi:MAG: TonB-dependent receptor [Bacteroidetes bacterium]|nr:TonB-dependent receptor [Bacteroidota bacterium]
MCKNIIVIVIIVFFFNPLHVGGVGYADSIPATIEKQLNEVQITEKKTARSLSVFKALNVASKATASSFTTAAMLQQIPSLSSDIEGNIRLRGNSKVTLLFEGIPLTLFEENRSDLLIQMPVELFSSILVFNMLPTSSINEGEAGAVDFIFSSAFSDKNGCKITLARGANNRYNASVLAGSRIGKFRWQAGYDFRKEYRYRIYKKTTVDKTGTAQMSNNAAAWPHTHIAMLNAQYLCGSSDIIDFTGLFQTMSYDRLGNINNMKTNTSGVIVANVLRQRNNSEKQTGNSEGLTWKHIWKEQKAWFEATMNYDNFDYNQGNNFANKKPGTDIILAQDRLFIAQNKHQWFASVKLSKQFSGGFTGQIGYNGQWHQDNYSASDDDLVNSAWVRNASKSNDYALNRNLHTGYAEVNYNTGQWHYLIGFQAQFDDRNGGRDEDANRTKQNKFYMLPHIEVVYQKSSFSSWSMRYQERLNRPVLNDLNPFVDRSDATYIHQGNPELQNELVHSAELSNTTRVGTIILNPVLFYRYRQDQLVDLAKIVNGITVWMKENASHSQDVGFEFNVAWKPYRLLTAEVSATGYHYEIDGARQGYGIKGRYSVDAKGSLMLKLPLGLVWNVYGYYTDRQLTVQGEIAALGSVGSSLSYSGCKNRLKLTLSIDNVFNSAEERTTFNAMGSQQYISRNRDARAVWLSAGYQL